MEISKEKKYFLENFQLYRVIQTNIVFVHGLTTSLCQDIEREMNKYGPSRKITTQKIKQNFYSAFVTFCYDYDAAKCVLSLNDTKIQNRYLRVYYGSTKFCPEYLMDKICQIRDCNYAHHVNPTLTHLKKDLKVVNHEAIARNLIETIQYNTDKDIIKQEKNNTPQWFEIDNEIISYLNMNKEDKLKKGKKTKIQQFLDEAQATLYSLIFKCNAN